jgi:hypothetical protein
MKAGIAIILLLLLALGAMPLVPAGTSESAVTAGQAAVPAGDCMAYSPVQGMPGMGAGERMGMMRGNAAATMPGSRGARHGREQPAGTLFRQELRRDPFDGNLPVRPIRARGYRRLSNRNILDNEKRQLIHDTILLNPGIGIPDLATATGINLHTLRYHLEYLVRMHKVACTEYGGGYRFFENHGRYDPADRQRILYERYPTTGRILALIGSRPGITRGAIAAELGLAGPSITRWTRRLTDECVVVEVRDGRCVHYYPAAEAGAAGIPRQVGPEPGQSPA